MKKQLSILIIGLLMISSLQAQIKIGENPEVLHPASVLELESTSRVLVITRMTTVQMESITPLQGAMVYNVDTECVHFFDGTQWINPCDQPDEQTFSTDPIVNANPTIVITEDGTNFNFEVGMIRGENIVPTSVNGQLHLQPQSITGDRIAAEAITIDKLAPGFTPGDILRWDGTGSGWVLVNQSDLGITEEDGIVGNEVTGPADGTLTLYGTGVMADPLLLGVSPNGITTLELDDDAVNSFKIQDGQVSNQDLATDAVTNDKMANDAVGTNEIINGSVTDAKLDKANIPLSGFGPATANVNMGGFQINDLQDPVLAQDAATMAYVDAEITASNAADGDTDSNNEIQDLDLTGDILTITNNAAPTSIDLSGYTNTDAQDISTDNNPGNITIQNGSTLNLNVDDADANATNEIQDLDLTGDILTITNNAAPTNIDLSGYTNTDAQDISTDNNPGNITIQNGSTLNLNVDDADANATNEIQDLDLTGDILTITNNAAPTSIDLSGYTNTDAQDISTDNNPGNITIQNGSTLNLNVDDADANATNEIQDLDLTGDILTITNNAAPTNIDLSGYTNTDAQDISTDNNPGNITIQNGSTLNLNVDDADANATNEIQDLDLTGDILTITNNAAPTNIDLSGYTNTDAQDLSITQNTLSISGGATTIDLAIKPITPLSVDDTLDNTHYTVILNAGISNLAFPAAGANLGRIYIIKNISGGPVSTDNYQDLFNATLNSIANNTTITIQSDGTSWQQIN